MSSACARPEATVSTDISEAMINTSRFTAPSGAGAVSNYGQDVWAAAFEMRTATPCSSVVCAPEFGSATSAVSAHRVFEQYDGAVGGPLARKMPELELGSAPLGMQTKSSGTVGSRFSLGMSTTLLHVGAGAKFTVYVAPF